MENNDNKNRSISDLFEIIDDVNTDDNNVDNVENNDKVLEKLLNSRLKFNNSQNADENFFEVDKSTKEVFSIENTELNTNYAELFKGGLDERLKLNNKFYELSRLSDLIEENEIIEKKVLEIKKYILEKVITEHELYISLNSLKENEKERYLEIRRAVIEQSRISLAPILEVLDIGPATAKTLISAISEWIIRDLFDYGLLYEILKKPNITNIKIENGHILYSEIGSKDTKIWDTNNRKLDNKEVEKLVSKIARDSVMLSSSMPIVDTVLPKLGYRVNLLLKNVTSSPTHIVNIRKNYDFINFDYYIKSGFFPKGWDLFFKKIVKERKNLVVAGGTGSGKTTFLNAVAKELISDKESLIVIEDTPELFVGKPSFVGFYAKDHICSVADLFKASLRQQPDRIFVGEIRDGNMAYYMIQAMNTGHDGNLSTIHASNAPQAIVRVNNLLKQSQESGGYDEKTISGMIRNSINYVLFVGIRRENNERKYKLLEVIRIRQEDPFLYYKELLNDAEKTIADEGRNTEEYIRAQASLDYVGLKLKYSPVEYDYLLKYDAEKEDYVINELDQLI